MWVIGGKYLGLKSIEKWPIAFANIQEEAI
jgi:hypothetical protein